MRILLFSVFVLFNLPLSFGADSTGIVRGRVYDRVSHEPLVAVNVVYGRNLGVITGHDGEFSFRARAGNYNVIFKYVGYRTYAVSLHLAGGDTLFVEAAMEHEIRQIDQIVVSANKTEQKVADLTVSMSVIHPEMIAQDHITDAEELVNKSPGIEVLDGQASIRGGSGFSYGAGSRVLALIDGLPMLSADAGNIKWSYLPLENLAQVEIIKGASSVLYGSSALNGVINFRTAVPDSIPVTRLYAEGGIYDRPRQKNWVWWDTPRVFSSASFSHMVKKGNTGISIGSGIFYDNGYRSLNDEKLGRLNAGIRHQSSRIDGLTYGVNLNSGASRFRDFILWQNASTGALMQDTSTAQLAVGTFLTVDPFISYKQSERLKHDLKSRIQYTSNSYPDGGNNNSSALSSYTEYQMWYRLLRFANLNTGLVGDYRLIHSEFYGDHNGLNVAGYAQVDMDVVKKLKMSGGVRLEQNYLDNKADQLVPIFRAGLNYHPGGYTFIRASFGQGYRYPSIAEKYAATTLGSIQIYPNPEIQSEKGWNSEVGIKQGVQAGNSTGQLDLAFFYQRNTDMIEYLFGLYPDPVTGNFGLGFKSANVEQSRIFGCELDYMLKRTSGELTTTLSGGYIYTYPVEYNPITHRNKDVFLKYRRKHSAKLNIENRYRKMVLGAGMYIRSPILNIDKVFLDETTRESFLPGFYEYWTNDNKTYFLMDVNLGYDLTDHFNLSLVIKNLTNTEYMGRPGDIRPQRSFGIRLSGKF